MLTAIRPFIKLGNYFRVCEKKQAKSNLTNNFTALLYLLWNIKLYRKSENTIVREN